MKADTRFSERRWMIIASILAATAAVLMVAPGCDEGGGPNVTESFRVVLVEPTAGSQNASCRDTIYVTFNSPLDTTAVYDDEAPRYFLATLQPGAALDVNAVFLSNPETSASGQPIPGTERTLGLPFDFLPSTNYTFNFIIARNQDGRELETSAQTTFRTAATGQQGCP